jgi:hypothetical protein
VSFIKISSGQRDGAENRDRKKQGRKEGTARVLLQHNGAGHNPDVISGRAYLQHLEMA